MPQHDASRRTYVFTQCKRWSSGQRAEKYGLGCFQENKFRVVRMSSDWFFVICEIETKCPNARHYYRHSSTLVAFADNIETLTPSPVHSAPRGEGRPSRMRDCGKLMLMTQLFVLSHANIRRVLGFTGCCAANPLQPGT